MFFASISSTSNYTAPQDYPSALGITIPSRPTARTGLNGTGTITIAPTIKSVKVDALDYSKNVIADLSKTATTQSIPITYRSTAGRFAHHFRVTITLPDDSPQTEEKAVTPFMNVAHYTDLAGPGFTYDGVKSMPGIRWHKRSHIRTMRQRGIRHLRLRMVELDQDGSDGWTDWDVKTLYETTNPANETIGSVNVQFREHVKRVVEDCLKEDIIPILAFDPSQLEETKTTDVRGGISAVDYLTAKYLEQWGFVHEVMPTNNLLSYNPWIEVGHYQAERVDVTNSFYASFRSQIRANNTERVIFLGSPQLSEPEALSLMTVPAGDNWLGAEFHAFAAGVNKWKPTPAGQTADEISTPWAANTAYPAGKILSGVAPAGVTGGAKAGQTYELIAKTARTSGATLDLAEWANYTVTSYSATGWQLNLGHIKFWPGFSTVSARQRAWSEDLVRQKFSQAKNWSTKTGIQTYFGAILATNTNQSDRFNIGGEGDHSLAEQADFIAKVMQIANDYGIPGIAWNSDNKYFDNLTDTWIPGTDSAIDAIVLARAAVPANAVDVAGSLVGLANGEFVWDLATEVVVDPAKAADLLWTVGATKSIRSTLERLLFYSTYQLTGKLISGPAINISLGASSQSVSAGGDISLTVVCDRSVDMPLVVSTTGAGTARIRNLKVQKV